MVDPDFCPAQPPSTVSPLWGSLSLTLIQQITGTGMCSSRVRGLFGRFLLLQWGCDSWDTLRDLSPARLRAFVSFPGGLQ